MTFDYLIDKIRAAEFDTNPFSHIYIENFFSPQHLREITRSAEIDISPASNDEELFSKLLGSGYKIIDFPGCVTDKDQYIRWHRERRVERNVTSTACEGFGMTLRLMSRTTPIVADLHNFLVSDAFRDALAEKFNIDLEAVFPDSGIQKYLDGYEISPHPDIRKKALTYMVNINPHAEAPGLDHHTHYLTFKDRFKYVQAFWEGNPNKDRCWVPWDWCDTVKQQTADNSIVIFAPSNDTVHGVKASYDHLKAQRTQLYGNLWYNQYAIEAAPSWEDYVIGRPPEPKPSTVDALKGLIPKRAKERVRELVSGRSRGDDSNTDPFVFTDRLKRP